MRGDCIVICRGVEDASPDTKNSQVFSETCRRGMRGGRRGVFLLLDNTALLLLKSIKPNLPGGQQSARNDTQSNVARRRSEQLAYEYLAQQRAVDLSQQIPNTETLDRDGRHGKRTTLQVT